jgi:hypothetical protein
MAKKSEVQVDGDQVFQGLVFTMVLTEVKPGQYSWQIKDSQTGRPISDGRRFQSTGRCLSALLKFVKHNPAFMGEVVNE